MNQIQPGDTVRLKTGTLNGGLGMNVAETNDDEALCDYFEGEESTHKQKWIKMSDLELVNKAEGGFF